MDADEQAYLIIKSFCPGAAIKCGRVLESTDTSPLTFRFRAEITAPNIKGILKLTGDSVASTTLNLNKKWAAARRAWDVDRLKEECQRLSGGNMTEDQLAHLENDLLHCSSTMYATLAGRARKSAQAMNTEAYEAA